MESNEFDFDNLKEQEEFVIKHYKDSVYMGEVVD
jgi:hypothetical protein